MGHDRPFPSETVRSEPPVIEAVFADVMVEKCLIGRIVTAVFAEGKAPGFLPEVKAVRGDKEKECAVADPFIGDNKFITFICRAVRIGVIKSGSDTRAVVGFTVKDKLLS